MTSLLAPSAMLPSGWARDVRIDIAPDGTIAAVTPEAGARGGATGSCVWPARWCPA